MYPKSVSVPIFVTPYTTLTYIPPRFYQTSAKPTSNRGNHAEKDNDDEKQETKKDEKENASRYACKVVTNARIAQTK
jgi:hypothetical protein